MAGGQNFLCGCAVAVAADAPRRIKEAQVVPECAVQLSDSGRRLVDQNHRALVAGEPLRRSDLIFPGESALRIRGEVHIVGRIGVDEVMAGQPDRLEIGVGECPLLEGVLVRREVVRVADARVSSEWDVEFALAIEPAQAVEAGAIEVIEQGGAFRGSSRPSATSWLKRVRWR